MIPVSAATRRRVDALFPANHREEVMARLQEECGDNLPMVETSYEQLAERIRFAVLKLSGGNIQQLSNQVQEAARDWRDVLMAAGFGEDVQAHLAWEPPGADRD